MRTVFADTHYWIAVASPRDSWKTAAKVARDSLGDVILVTTDEVLVEFLNALAGYGSESRRRAARMVESILINPNIRVFPQSRDSLHRGLAQYASRLDKEYSLVDCVSMTVMRSERIPEVLTNDHHFEQEGFVVLIKQE